ncbi:MAG: sigma-54 dependent transcriptional regulator [Desulfobulbaceae bacterium]|nr:sigma-54 dependent transcriptional regulator [Desulfobulbaceae bacterium]HIJ78586.1 sigma-54-dependent Fis family transcriptional regulator [Deltaproteobacteria bacterium]
MTTIRILLAEDDEIMRVTLGDRLKKQGWQVDEAEDGRAALAKIGNNRYHVVISDIRMPHANGLELLDVLLQSCPNTDIIFMTAYGSVEDAVACLKKGATDYLLKPFDMDDLIIRVKRLLENQALKARYISMEDCCRQFRKPIIGSSKPVRDMIAMIGQVAASDATVLITGESGTGKELVASAIHFSGKRAAGPYVRINCAAIPEGLMESELFGHEKGSFTGAEARRVGRFEMADGGTLLLDEIGEMPLHLQAKLLRVLQEKEIERVGGTKSVKVDVRILCATAKNLVDEVKKGNFREDLFYRLQVIPIVVPPLRERRDDIPELCRYFIDQLGGNRQKTMRISEEAMAVLMAYDFPGNIRELHNIVERLLVLASSDVVQPWDLPNDLTGEVAPGQDETLRLSEAVAAAEKSCILRALRKVDGKKAEAADLLGISRKNLWEKMKLHHIGA